MSEADGFPGELFMGTSPVEEMEASSNHSQRPFLLHLEYLVKDYDRNSGHY